MATGHKLRSFGVLMTGMCVCAYAYAEGGGSNPTAPSNIVVVPSATATAATVPPAVTTATAVGPSVVAATATPGFAFGVQTHFSQGWSPSWLALATQVGATNIRDTVNWASVEKTPGTYDFSGTAIATLQGFCAKNGKITLTIVPKNGLYDGGKTVSTTAGKTAYAAYINALLGRFGSCISAIEVGNEINIGSNLDYPAGLNPATTYVGLLKTLYAAVKPRYPGVTILGGSTNAVGTGFLDELFAAGALTAMDAVAVHPYRGSGEGLDTEINHLRDVMRKYGNPVGIWATEFSYDTTDKRLAAAGLVKSATLLSASGVDHASWYALVDQSFFPNMGLFTGTSIKPVGLAYTTVMQRLFAYGRATRIDTGDSLTYLYRFGADRWLVWGAPRTITFSGNATTRDIVGMPVGGGTVQIGPEPIIIEGASGYTLGDSAVVADTALQWGSAPWSYYRRGSDNKDIALGWFDNDFTSYFGDRWSKPLRINSDSAAPAGDGSAPMRAILRYTSPKAQQIDLDACLRKADSGDGVDYRIDRNGVKIAGGVLVTRSALQGIQLNLAAGDRIDLIFGPNQTYGGDSFSYRAILRARSKGTPLACA